MTTTETLELIPLPPTPIRHLSMVRQRFERHHAEMIRSIQEAGGFRPSSRWFRVELADALEQAEAAEGSRDYVLLLDWVGDVRMRAIVEERDSLLPVLAEVFDATRRCRRSFKCLALAEGSALFRHWRSR